MHDQQQQEPSKVVSRTRGTAAVREERERELTNNNNLHFPYFSPLQQLLLHSPRNRMSYQIKRTPYYRRIFNNSRRNGQLQRLREEYERIQEFNDRTIELKMRQVRLKRLFREIDDINEPPSHGHGHGGRRMHPAAPPPPLLPPTPEAMQAQARRHRLESLERARELGQEISRRNAEMADAGTGFYLRSELRNTMKMRAADDARREAQERRQRAARRISYGNAQSRSNVERIQQRRQRQEVAEAMLYRSHSYAAQLIPVAMDTSVSQSPEIVKRSMLQQRLQYGNSRSSKNMMRSQLLAAQRVMNCISISDVVTAKEVHRLRHRQNDNCSIELTEDEDSNRQRGVTNKQHHRIQRSHHSHRHHRHHRHHHHDDRRESIQVELQRQQQQEQQQQQEGNESKQLQRVEAGAAHLVRNSLSFMDAHEDSSETITMRMNQMENETDNSKDCIGDRNDATCGNGGGGGNGSNNNAAVMAGDDGDNVDEELPTTSQRALQLGDQPTVPARDPWHRVSHLPLPWFSVMQDYSTSGTILHNNSPIVAKEIHTGGDEPATDHYLSIESGESVMHEDTLDIIELNGDDDNVNNAPAAGGAANIQ